MATVSLETLDAEVEVSPYTGLTAIQRQQSGIARALVSLIWPQTTLTGTSSGEIKGLSFQGSLPRNFAYTYAGGSFQIGRTASADVLNQLNGVYFENVISCTIQESATRQDSWTMQTLGTTRSELDLNFKEDGGTTAYIYPGADSTTSDAHFATPGTYDPYSDFYKKIYNDLSPPTRIYRGTDGDVDVFCNVANMVLDPFPSSAMVAVGRMHFIQYDIDQAYNYAIHSPVPVRNA